MGNNNWFIDKEGYARSTSNTCYGNCTMCERQICALDFEDEIDARLMPYEPMDDEQEEEERDMFYGYTKEEIEYED